MFAKRELGAAGLVCVAAVLLSPVGTQTSIVPAGLLAGFAGVGSASYPDAVVRGGRAGALGGLGYVGVVALLAAGRMGSMVGAAFAVDMFLFTSFAMLIMLVPLYGIEGLAVGPLGHWVGRKASRTRESSASTLRSK